MDSDDTLTLDAVETVLRYHRRYEDEKNICGYAFLRVHLDGNVNGKEFVPNERVASYTEARVNSDDTILVDDGSPDNCPTLCEDWAKKDSRIKVVHKKNAGLGYARNTGIENATGEYICFFDSDDYIALDAIEKAYSLAVKEKSDIIVFGFCDVKSNGETGKTVIPKTEKVTYSGNEVQNVFLADLIGPDVKNGTQTNLWMSAWASMYSLDMIRKASWKFVSEREIISEDIYSLLELYKYVNRVSVLSEALYFYCENASSLTHTYKKDRYSKIKDFYNACYQLIENNGYDVAVLDRITYPYLSNTIAALKMIILSDASKNVKKQEVKEIVDDEHLQTVLRCTNYDNEKLTRKILLDLMKSKQYGLCYILLSIKAR